MNTQWLIGDVFGWIGMAVCAVSLAIILYRLVAVWKTEDPLGYCLDTWKYFIPFVCGWLLVGVAALLTLGRHAA